MKCRRGRHLYTSLSLVSWDFRACLSWEICPSFCSSIQTDIQGVCCIPLVLYVSRVSRVFSETLCPPYINWNTCVSESRTCKMREVTICEKVVVIRLPAGTEKWWMGETGTVSTLFPFIPLTFQVGQHQGKSLDCLMRHSMWHKNKIAFAFHFLQGLLKESQQCRTIFSPASFMNNTNVVNLSKPCPHTNCIHFCIYFYYDSVENSGVVGNKCSMWK